MWNILKDMGTNNFSGVNPFIFGFKILWCNNLGDLLQFEQIQKSDPQKINNHTWFRRKYKEVWKCYKNRKSFSVVTESYYSTKSVSVRSSQFWRWRTCSTEAWWTEIVIIITVSSSLAVGFEQSFNQNKRIRWKLSYIRMGIE